MRRPLVVALVGLAAVVAGIVVWGLIPSRPRTGGPPEVQLYVTHCADCHGDDGRGSLRASLFLLRPGDLANGAAMARYTDKYLFDLIKSGGSPIGRPGMPGFEALLTDQQIETLVAYLRRLSGSSRS